MGTDQVWYAVGVASRHEKIVSQLLRNKGFETFLPLHTRKHQYGRRVRSFELPLFPGYLFCRMDNAVRLSVVTTPGVLRLVGAGKVPVAVADDEIAALQRATAANATLSPHPYWKSGEKGRIGEGPLSGLEGIIVSAKPPVKVVISVTLLQRSVLVEVDANSVARA